MKLSDKELVQLFIDADERAQKLFIEKYKKWVVGVAMKQFKLDLYNANEIFQIVLLNLIENDYKVLKAWQGKSKFSTYLTVIVTRRCIKYLKKNKKETPVDEELYKNTESDNLANPEQYTESLYKLELIQTHMKELKPRDQLLLSYRFVDEREPTEIAQILNMKPATVRKAIHDALTRLRNKLPIDVTLIVLTALIRGR